MDNTEINNTYKEGAKFALDEAAKWIYKEIGNYVSWDGEIEKEELIADFKSECSKIIGL